jgi:Predicted phosphoesterase
MAGDALVYGHTHIPVAEKRGDIYHFNPGSVSIPKGEYPASYGMRLIFRALFQTMKRLCLLRWKNMEPRPH